MDSVLGPIFDAIGWLLSIFYSVIPNLGVAIILMTIVVMLLLYPLTAKQAKSMIAMQRLQPEIKKLQAKYKGDRQKLNEETMKFYQENKINPLAGCLPLLVQMPILISLVSVLRNAYKYVPTSSSLYDALCHGFGKLGKGGWSLCGTSAKSASQFGGFSKGETLIHHLNFLGIDLQNSASGKHDGLVDALPYFLLVALVMVTGFLQTRQAQRRTPAANKQMAAVMKVLPVMFGLFSVAFPSGVVLYFFVSSLIRLGQQEIIFRRFGSAVHGPGGKPLDVKSSERPKKGAPPAVIEVADEPELVEETSAAPPPETPRRPAPATGRAAGLRGMLQLPPPPEGNGDAAVGAPSSGQRAGGGQAKASGSGGGASRASSSRRRRGKKKRKR